MPLPGALSDSTDTLAATLLDKHGSWLDKTSATHLATTYGTGCHTVVALAEQDQTLRERTTPDSPVLRAEIVHAVRNEMALRLTDVVVRRTALGAAGHPGSMSARACADILARELHWTVERASNEIEALNDFYHPIGA